MTRMTLYHALDRCFPRSYRLKIFAIAFVGTHVPLLATTFWALSSAVQPNERFDVLLLLLAVTLVGTAGTLLGLWLVLTPVELCTKAVLDYRGKRTLPSLDRTHADSAGHLMCGISDLVHEVDRLLRDGELLAFTDSLTGLMNRRGFNRAFSELTSISVDLVENLSVAVFDLDLFKSVNDTYGHAAGDRVLKSFSNVVRSHIGSADVAARLGGEEFVVLFKGASKTKAMEVCSNIRLSLSQMKLLPGPVTTSAGFAPVEAGEAIDQALAHADKALYAAKRGGRNRVVEFVRIPAALNSPHLSLVN